MYKMKFAFFRCEIYLTASRKHDQGLHNTETKFISGINMERCDLKNTPVVT